MIRRIVTAIFTVVILGGLGIAILVSWLGRRQYESAIAPLAGVPNDPAIRELERRWGFSGIETRFVVQVTPVGDPFDAPDNMWSAYEVDRREGQAPLSPDARGVAIEWSEDDALSLDALNRFLPAERLARTPDEIAWIAFVHRSTVVNLYSYEGARSDHASPPLERIDVRVAPMHGEGLIGRLSAEAIPPMRARGGRVDSMYTVRAPVVGQGLAELLDDTRVALVDPTAPLPTACFESTLPPLTTTDTFDVRCTDGATQACIAACLAGSAGSCVRTGLALEQGWWHRPEEVFRRACVAGSARGCASFGARWLERAPGDELATSCSAALFERACSAGDAYGCRLVESTRVHAAH